MTASHGVGISRPRSDSRVNVTGALRYAADRRRPGTLHARLVLATHAHAGIRSIEVADARAVREVVAVLTATDLGLLPERDRLAIPLAADEVVFAGQPVAMLLAETEAAAAGALDLIVVDMERPSPVHGRRRSP